jgi:hypothetical protein
MRPLVLLLCLLFTGTAFAQTTPARASLSLDFGSMRNRYLYPINNLRFESGDVGKLPLRISARLRCYGTWVLFSKDAYDLTPLAEWRFGKGQWQFAAGAGFEARLRLVNDERSQAESSVEPLVSLTGSVNHGKWAAQLPLWTRFYSNGLSLTLQPEVSYSFAQRWKCLARVETGCILLTSSPGTEWRLDSFLGVGYSLH